MDCQEIIEQLNANRSTSVSKDLQYIIDMIIKYK